MKASELKNKSMEELTAKAAELSQELFNLRFQLHTGRLENTAKISSVKKDIARIKTILSEKRG
ncbi:50S ribosomal protein L29 [Geobacter sulfurreducens]|uniref:Large ribosomal subunit protein uL29 n=1 Tax=Geobacter sulfurreducens (strain ATCC 51573 / DSM 12127 / PCA) TaxID=243231 RepID=RL29_GEOSL|nr:50S ribosomal protein L29 [Geobacter sulfurreducens]Q748Z6.2 RecName: Full=Large ribosomal subunit protein uL29; AltName: Full=50S ribosomal protein L29 [Geobacter sulfurreducens PCA]AAR36242.2 ribosomal protein L29 [Geobacter sulfurreducens PCA]ADI85603.1 ribosomal protein L29 [Geobacter sulfurreducens KN400]AJY69117.1 50S ribosomal protein L29 [Geobacter sulfurreducens]QVW34665.1 50S ribosomal protein L29 [Geobacter sulfurreducens]UAC03534.1 50S ribosomal protein L29 [Geobacter sulfurred